MSLLSLTAVAPHTRAVYLAVVLASVVVGVLLLSLTHCRRPLWLQIKQPLALAASAVGVLVFILGTQPYAAALTFVFLTIQVLLLLKR